MPDANKIIRQYAKAPAFTVNLGDGWALGPDGYEHFVEVVASAIQATADAVKDWSNQVASIGADGTLQVKTAS